MTKLLEWLSGVSLTLAVWYHLVTSKKQYDMVDNHPLLVLWSPLLAIIAFGLYSVAVIAYRVWSFNDCEEASAQLQKQITEAREDLRHMGFKFE